MPTRIDILRLLADGCFHSGTELGAALGVSRAAVCKGVKGLTATGVRVHRVAGRGYRLPTPCTLLDAAAIQRNIGPVPLPASLEIFDELDSTSQHLLRGNAASGAVCLAERQSAGRGRRGRQWLATPYRNLMMSLAWRFDSGPAAIAGLSLAAGVAVMRALTEYGIGGIGLKWPNDVIARGRKLAGLLVDVRGEAAGPCSVVLGIGLNVALDGDEADKIDQAWIDLQTLHGAPIDRNRLAGLVIRHAFNALARFADTGLAAFAVEWESSHVFAGQRVRLLHGETVHSGVVRGIDAQGGLVVEDEGGCRVYFAGEVSLRAAS